MLEFEKRKCLKCGEMFVKTSGGIIFRPTKHTCPRCGSHWTVRWYF